jgi:exonuclease VII large subunit
VPVTARLSRRFYDAIGDDAANDLVNWMNAVDLTYRNELLQHNEANFSRFSATLEARFAATWADIDRRFAEVGQRLDKIEQRLDKIEQRLESLEARMDTRFAQFESRMLKWMLVFWTTTMLGAAATVIAVLQAR